MFLLSVFLLSCSSIKVSNNKCKIHEIDLENQESGTALRLYLRKSIFDSKSKSDTAIVSTNPIESNSIGLFLENFFNDDFYTKYRDLENKNYLMIFLEESSRLLESSKITKYFMEKVSAKYSICEETIPDISGEMNRINGQIDSALEDIKTKYEDFRRKIDDKIRFLFEYKDRKGESFVDYLFKRSGHYSQLLFLELLQSNLEHLSNVKIKMKEVLIQLKDDRTSEDELVFFQDYLEYIDNLCDSLINFLLKKNGEGFSPLYRVVDHDNIKALECVVNNFPNLLLKSWDSEGNGALSLCIEKSRKRHFDLILDNKNDEFPLWSIWGISNKNEKDAIACAMSSEDEYYLKKLILSGATVNYYNDGLLSYEPFILAISNSNVEIMKLLIANSFYFDNIKKDSLFRRVLLKSSRLLSTSLIKAIGWTADNVVSNFTYGILNKPGFYFLSEKLSNILDDYLKTKEEERKEKTPKVLMALLDAVKIELSWIDYLDKDNFETIIKNWDKTDPPFISTLGDLLKSKKEMVEKSFNSISSKYDKITSSLKIVSAKLKKKFDELTDEKNRIVKTIYKPLQNKDNRALDKISNFNKAVNEFNNKLNFFSKSLNIVTVQFLAKGKLQ